MLINSNGNQIALKIITHKIITFTHTHTHTHTHTDINNTGYMEPYYLQQITNNNYTNITTKKLTFLIEKFL